MMINSKDKDTVAVRVVVVVAITKEATATVVATTKEEGTATVVATTKEGMNQEAVEDMEAVAAVDTAAAGTLMTPMEDAVDAEVMVVVVVVLTADMAVNNNKIEQMKIKP